MSVELAQLWEAASVILALQATSFGWRINREAALAEDGQETWMPVADMVNLVAMGTSVMGIFIAPVLGIWGVEGAVIAFGVVLILMVGHATSLAAHYELFQAGKRSHAYFPAQERVAVCVTAAVVLVYVLTALW